jgi:uncharacterized phiE125 gp8 family phage protein
MTDIWGWNPPLVGDFRRSVFAPPRARLLRIRRSAEMPLSLAETVLHLRLDVGAENGPEKPLIKRLIAAATGALEEHASISVMEQDWRMTLRHWPPIPGDGLEFPMPPFKELLRIRVDDQVVPNADYYFVHEERSSRMFPVSGRWGAAAYGYSRRPDRVIIDFRAGHTTRAEVPESLRQAMLLAIGTWYENRESLQQFTLTPLIGIGWRDLINHHREPGFA